MRPRRRAWGRSRRRSARRSWTATSRGSPSREGSSEAVKPTVLGEGAIWTPTFSNPAAMSRTSAERFVKVTSFVDENELNRLRPVGNFAWQAEAPYTPPLLARVSQLGERCDLPPKHRFNKGPVDVELAWTTSTGPSCAPLPPGLPCAASVPASDRRSGKFGSAPNGVERPSKPYETHGADRLFPTRPWISPDGISRPRGPGAPRRRAGLGNDGLPSCRSGGDGRRSCTEACRPSPPSSWALGRSSRPWLQLRSVGDSGCGRIGFPSRIRDSDRIRHST